MKKILSIIALTLVFCCSSLTTKAVCTNFFSAGWNGTAFFFTFGGDTIFEPNNCGLLFATAFPPAAAGGGTGTFASGTALIFKVACGRDYLWQSCDAFGFDWTTDGDFSNPNAPGTMDQVMSIFEFDFQNGLVGGLLDTDDDGCGQLGGPSALAWNSTIEGWVILLVSDFSCQTDPGSSFDLLFTCSGTTSAPAANNECVNATDISCNSTSLGSTAACATQTIFGACPGAGTGLDGPETWYKISPPAGSFVTASTCNAGTSYDTELTIVEGNCFLPGGGGGPIFCVAANDDAPGLCFNGGNLFASEVSWCAGGGDYYVIVHGFAGATGDYELSVNCAAPLMIDAGDCQSHYLGYAPAEDDTNYLVATASGGSGPYEYVWTPSGLGVGMGGTGLAVSPAVTTCYTVTVTDANGCTASDDVCVNVIDITCIKGTKSSKEGVTVCKCKTKSSKTSKSSKSSKSTKSSECKEKCVTLSSKKSKSHSHSHKSSKSSKPDKVQKLLAKNPENHLGACDNPCLATNDAFVICQAIDISILTDDFGNETTWSLTDLNTSTVVKTGGPYPSATQINDQYLDCDDHCYEFTIFDSFGDGICCGFGMGNYSVTYQGQTVATGGAFGSSESTQFGECASLCFIEVCITTNGFGDEISWNLAGSGLSGGPVDFGATTCAQAVAPNNVGNYTFNFESQGSFNDNTGSYTITCGGTQAAGGNFVGGDVITDPIVSCCSGGGNKFGGIEEAVQDLSVKAYPNPFNGSTTIEFNLPTDDVVTLEVFDMTGMKVATLFKGSVEKGIDHSVEFNGNEMPAGIYIYRLVTDSGIEKHDKLYLVK